MIVPGAEAIFWPAISPTAMMLRFVEVTKTSSAVAKSSGLNVCSTTEMPASGAISIKMPRVTPSRQPELRRRKDFVAFHDENIRRGTLSDFSALVQQNHFVESFLLRFGDGPNVGQPGNRFYARERGGGVASVLANGEAHRLVIVGKGRSVDDEIDLRHCFFAAPSANLVVNQIDARAAFADFVGANDFLQMDANFCAAVWHGKANDGGVFFQTAPMTLVAEGFAFHDANRGEEAPAANDSRLPG